jgi:hypothetical protein
MSYLNQCLLLFGYVSIEDVTKDLLKKSFRKKMLEIHPDKGGDADEFDKLISSFLYLNNTLNRVNGGRNVLSEILEPDEITKHRNNEIIHELFQELEMEEFHQKFEEKESELLKNGYDSWFRSQDDFSDIPKINGIDSETFNDIFKELTLKGKEITTLSLHLNDMATNSSHIGTNIIETDNINFTSQFGVNPGFTDLYSAYTDNNIFIDKIPQTNKNKTFDEYIKERDDILNPITDSEKELFIDYEKKEYEKQKKHYSNLQAYFGENYIGICNLTNKIEDTDDTFIREF